MWLCREAVFFATLIKAFIVSGLCIPGERFSQCLSLVSFKPIVRFEQEFATRQSYKVAILPDSS